MIKIRIATNGKKMVHTQCSFITVMLLICVLVLSELNSMEYTASFFLLILVFLFLSYWNLFEFFQRRSFQTAQQKLEHLCDLIDSRLENESDITIASLQVELNDILNYINFYFPLYTEEQLQELEEKTERTKMQLSNLQKYIAS